ncbi:hypothetical protein CKO11_13970 [Rhodobacter sp. TJ_12]|uniref:hypothetical protein n=1 Tax=Rhodobacter sp. TJ_12 TaxID=2029399 RepID=UPI001CC088C9|nr:hypothetical protein [Rhodobacter sp. TJ_12]MBZ4023565.1 hypothetical protein [Rhodobacter sp. TJ_12]
MGFIAVLLLTGGGVSALFRTAALSPLAHKLTRHRVWVLDSFNKYAWIAAGLVLLILLITKAETGREIAIVGAAWMAATAAVWFLPPALLRFF